MDNNGVNPSISPPGEAIADIHAVAAPQTRPASAAASSRTRSAAGTATPATAPRRRLHRRARHRLREAPLRPAAHDHLDPRTASRARSAAAPAARPPARPRADGALRPRDPLRGHGRGRDGLGPRSTRDLLASAVQLRPQHRPRDRHPAPVLRRAGPVGHWYTCAVGGGCAATGGYLNCWPPTTTTATSPTARRT